MNYYEHHLGDWAAATGHLTWDEDMAYTRLLRAYYHAEKAIADGQQYRLAKASTPAQRKAVDTVLAEFFTLADGAWHQKRADEEIARYHDGEPEREVKKANESIRLKRHRDERAALFKVITAAGQHAAWNTNMNELRELAKRCASPLPATAPATPATATQTPSTIPSTQEKEDSVPTGTGGTPPPAVKVGKAKTAAEQESAKVWSDLKLLLIDQQACPTAKAAGEVLGKHATKYGKDVFLEAGRATIAANPVDALTYLVALCETAAGKRVALGRPGPLTDEQRESINAASDAAAKRLLFGARTGEVIDA